MPLYKLGPAQYHGFLAFFSTNSNNGVMGRKELAAALGRAGCNPSSAELSQIIDLISVDANGISWQCFVDYVGSYTSFRNEVEEYQEAFRIYDISGNGYLTREDIKYIMQKLNMKVDVDRLMEEVDTNRDNKIDYDEFVAMMKRQVF